MSTFAALIEEGLVVQVIVGDVAWANDRLAGVWVGSDVLVGIGWSYVDGEFVPPEPEPYDGDELDEVDL
jgi:hypothetical protein